MSDWKLIDDAAKDGSPVLIFKEGWEVAVLAKWDFEDGGEDCAFWGWRFEDDYLCIGVDDGFLGWQDDIDDGCMPTHYSKPPTEKRND